METIGEQIREARIAAGLTQAQLADASGFGQSLISRYEKGERWPPILHLRMIAAATKATFFVNGESW
jgi:transcriptional regulator with XRE-family HTH domain